MAEVAVCAVVGMPWAWDVDVVQGRNGRVVRHCNPYIVWPPPLHAMCPCHAVFWGGGVVCYVCGVQGVGYRKRSCGERTCEDPMLYKSVSKIYLMQISQTVSGYV